MTEIVDLDHEDPEKKKPEVNHPSHYNRGKVEVIDFIEAKGHGLSFCAGNAIKYLIRFDAKDDLASNMKKAFWYIKRIEHRGLKKNPDDYTKEALRVYPYLPPSVADVVDLVVIGYYSLALFRLRRFMAARDIEPEVDTHG